MEIKPIVKNILKEVIPTAQKLAGPALLIGSVVGVGAGGYYVGETFNDTSPVQVAEAWEKTEIERQEYVSLAPDASCERNVLSTIVTINAVNTPSKISLTRNALDTVCGQVDGHGEMAQKAVQQYKVLRSAKGSANHLAKTSVFDTEKKILSVMFAESFVYLSLASAYGISRVMRKRRHQNRFQHQVRYGSPQVNVNENQ